MNEGTDWFNWIGSDSIDTEKPDGAIEPAAELKKGSDKVRDRFTGSKQNKIRQKEHVKKVTTTEPEEEPKAAMTPETFFEAEGQIETGASWRELGLHTLLVRTLMSEPLCFFEPTSVQARTIPVALKSRDVCASAETGSGKTAAFGLPILHRLLQSDRSRPRVRAVILNPTRELAVQTVEMLNALASKITPAVRISLIVGGKNDRDKQRAELNTLPDIVVATPARLIDHVTNKRGPFDLSTVEVLILDEADRVLQVDFMDQILEITRALPHGHQTMLFSATMTEQVEALVEVLRRPVRIKAEWDSRLVVAKRLHQEFVRVRTNTVPHRRAVLVSLLASSFADNTVIVFFSTKRDVHETAALLSVLGLRAVELQGDLTQAQRLANLGAFRAGSVRLILCTDVAARGLDIPSVDVVVNFTLPQTIETYVHRVGRTARAKRTGRSVTLFGDDDPRAMLKRLMTLGSKDVPVKQRKVPADAISTRLEEIQAAMPAVRDALAQEAAEAELAVAENMVAKAEALTVPGRKKTVGGLREDVARTWFMGKERRKQLADLQRQVRKGDITERDAFRALKAGGTGKLAPTEDDKVMTDARRAVRAAKKVNRAKKLQALTEDPDAGKVHLGRAKRYNDAGRRKRL